ncbi:variant 4, Delta 8 Fatty Acid Desaturase [Lathyrus oleraceus]|uniref:Variant 4, Delta 8 Fatty Acid Desaturase n=1 Tax=Pisum sativum TaxID=3888 RepID=A0A9D4XFB3_PEA|nr:variant 4, Delta 8 Fatty Acid Desaturase [Pisum sativum]
MVLLLNFARFKCPLHWVLVTILWNALNTIDQDTGQHMGLDYDPDLQHIPVFAVSSRLFGNIKSYFYDRHLKFDALSRFLISYQHWTFYPVLCFTRLNLYVQTFLLLFSLSRNVPDRLYNIMGTAVFLTWFPLLLSCLPSWPERLMFALACFVVCSIQHLQFYLNHFAPNVYVGPPSGNVWFEKHTSRTVDISCSTRMDWFFCGYQFQLEHHLFPRLPRAQLKKVSPLVTYLCKKHNFPYRSLTFVDANL